MLSLLLPCSSSSPGDQQPAHEVWTRHLHENRERWKAQCEKKGNPSHMQAQKNYWHIHTYTSPTHIFTLHPAHIHTPPAHAPGDDRPSTMNGQESNHSNHDNSNRGNMPGNTVKQKKHSTVETHTVSTVELCKTPGGSETKTIRTVETRTVTTDEATIICKKGQQPHKNISNADT